MSALELDDNHDIKVEGGNVSFLTGIDAIRQHLGNRLQVFKGEWFLDESIGIPFFDEVKKKNPDIAVLNAIFSSAILQTPGIVSLDELNFDLDGAARELRIQFSARTITGEAITDTVAVGG